VITFHLGHLPGVCYRGEFPSLAAARDFFQLPTPSAAEQLTRAENARRLKALGRTHKQIAEELGVSPATVKRDLRGGGSKSLF